VNPQLLKGTVDLLTLAVLQRQRLHGYDIAKALRTLSNDRVILKQGTLYPTLHRLEERGLIVGEWEDQRGTPSRFVYSITPAGRAAFDERRAEWDQLREVVETVLETMEPAR
jgi:PadR family transcriptional regulator PadR